MVRVRALIVVIVVVVVAAVAAACSNDDNDRNDGAQVATTTVPVTQPLATVPPGREGRAVLRGNATLDGAPLDAEFLGAVVRHNGLVTPCQAALPPVDNGLYAISVLSDDEAAGCGTLGGEILLWAFTNEKRYFSTGATSWPGNGSTATFDATFATATPEGDVGPRTEIAAEVFERDGRQLADGTLVEAYIGKTLCGVASVRTSGDFTGVSISVVGPDSVAGCTRGARVNFRIDGRPATTTAVNNFRDVRALRVILP
jgi:hypothetical protein